MPAIVVAVKQPLLLASLLTIAACSGSKNDELPVCEDCDAGPGRLDGGEDIADSGADELDAGGDAAAEQDATAQVDAEAVDAASGPVCSAGERRCSSATLLEVCNAQGQWSGLECDEACASDTDAGIPECLASDLSQWMVRLFPISDAPTTPSASYSFSSDGTVATQTVNANPSIYLNSRVFSNVRVRGRFSVSNADADDDMVGFAFGYQDDAHFYLLDWKQVTQGPAPTSQSCLIALAGISLKRVSGTEAPNLCADFWSSAGTEKVVVLSPASAHPVGWRRNVNYDFLLEHGPGSIRIEILDGSTRVALIESNDATYGEGKFAFYNYSQLGVRYEGFHFEPKP